MTGKPSTFPPSPHDHDASDITSGAIPINHGGTGLADGPNGDYLKFGGGNIIMETISPSGVRADIGAENASNLSNGTVPDNRLVGGDVLPVLPIGWTTISLTSNVSSPRYNRVRRFATGQVEIQLDVKVDSSAGNFEVGTLPYWAAVTGPDQYRMAATTGSGSTHNIRIDIYPDGHLQCFTGGGSSGFVGLFTTYTP